MKTRANFAFPDKDLKKWKLAATARGVSLTEFMTKAGNSYLSSENKSATAGNSDPRLEVIIQALQKLHDFPAMIMMLNKIFKTVDETGKGITAMIEVDDDIRKALLKTHPELRAKFQQ